LAEDDGHVLESLLDDVTDLRFGGPRRNCSRLLRNRSFRRDSYCIHSSIKEKIISKKSYQSLYYHLFHKRPLLKGLMY
jgi:hypothetical protein